MGRNLGWPSRWAWPEHLSLPVLTAVTEGESHTTGIYSSQIWKLGKSKIEAPANLVSAEYLPLGRRGPSPLRSLTWWKKTCRLSRATLMRALIPFMKTPLSTPAPPRVPTS